jgi:hypothetical protein
MSQVITGTPTPVSARVHSIRWGLAALAVAAALTVFGAYGDPHPKANQEQGVPFICGVLAVLAVGIFGFLVPAVLRGATARPARACGWGLTLSILGVLAVPVAFWSGLPLLLGTAGILLGTAGRRAARDAGRGTAMPGWAVGVGTFAIVACLAIGIVGTVALPN